MRIAFDSRHVLAASQRFGYLAAAFHQDRIHDVKRTMLDAALDATIAGSAPCVVWLLLPQRVVYVAALFSLCRQSRCPAQVGLISEHDEKFCLLALSSVLDHPWRDLARGTVDNAESLRELGDRTRRADRPYHRIASSDEEEQAKQRSQSGNPEVRFPSAIIDAPEQFRLYPKSQEIVNISATQVGLVSARPPVVHNSKLMPLVAAPDSARPAGRSWRFKRKHVDDAAHAIFEVRETKLGICERLTKRVLIKVPVLRKLPRCNRYH